MGVRRLLSTLMLGILLMSMFSPLLGGLNPVGGAAAVDSDYDGWSDEYENAIGTDPHNPDTDGDGINDPDDPTPKGSLINEEEVWETFDVTVETSVPFCMQGEEITVYVNVTQDGNPVKDRNVWLLVYRENWRYSDFMHQFQMKRPIDNGAAIFEITVDAGEYYFIATPDHDNVSAGAEMDAWELRDIAYDKHGGYTEMTVYAQFIVTIDSIYDNILQGQKGSFEIHRYRYSKKMAREYIENSGSRPDTFDIYKPDSGKVSIYVVKSSIKVHNTEIHVPSDGKTWHYRFNRVGYQTVTATPYPARYAANATYSHKFPFAVTSIRVHYPLVRWVEIPNVNIPEQDDVKVHAYYILTSIGPELFNELYRSIGMEGIAEQYPEHTSAWAGDVRVSLIYREWYRRCWLMKSATVHLDGTGGMPYNFHLPGYYEAVATFNATHSFPSGRVFDRGDHYLRSGRDDDFYHRTTLYPDVIVNIFPERNVFFPGEECSVLIQAMDGASPTNEFQVALFEEEKYLGTYSLGADGSASINIGEISYGQRMISAVPLFGQDTLEIVKAIKLEYLDWIPDTGVQSRRYSIHLNAPYRMVRELGNDVHVMVYGDGYEPVEGASVEVWLRRVSGTYVYTRILVLEGTTDLNGSFVGTVIPVTNGYINNIRVVVRTENLTDSYDKSMYLRDREYDCQISTDKPVYRGGDTIQTRFLLWDPNLVQPVTAPVNIKLVDPYERTIYRTTIETDVYGLGYFSFPLPDELPWGYYEIWVNHSGQGFVESVQIREYELPEVDIRFEDAPKKGDPYDDVEIPLRAEYMFGMPLTEGSVTFTVERYNPWSWYYRHWGGYYGFVSIYEADDEDTDALPITKTVTVKNGWANLTFELPDIDGSVIITAEFTDRFGHEDEAEHILSLGEKSVKDTAHLSLSAPEEAYMPSDELLIEVETTYINAHGETKQLGDTEVAFEVRVRSAREYSSSTFDFNGITDEDGRLSIDLWTVESIDLQALLEDDLLWFEVTAFINSSNVMATESTTNETEFKVYRYELAIDTEETAYQAGDLVDIDLSIYDHVIDDVPEGHCTLWVNRSSVYDADDTYDYRFQHLAPIFVKRITLGDERSFTVGWDIPDIIPAGIYIISLTHRDITVERNIAIGSSDADLVIEASTESEGEYRPGENITLTITTNDAVGRHLFIDIDIGGGRLRVLDMPITGDVTTVSYLALDHRHPLRINAFFISENGNIVRDSVVLEERVRELDVMIEPDDWDLDAGEMLHLNATVVDGYGNPVLDPMVFLSIVDEAVFDYAGRDNYHFDLNRNYVQPWDLVRYYRLGANAHEPHVTITDHDGSSSLLWPEEKYGYYGGYGDDWYYLEFGVGVIDSDSDGLMDKYSSNSISYESMPRSASLDQTLSAELEQTHIRSDFRETAFWVPGVVAEGGKVTWAIKMPDNLAKWRITAFASTLPCLAGYSEIHVNTTTDFFVQSVMPHVVTQDDEFTFPVRVHNLVKEDLDVTVGLQADNWLKVFGSPQQDIKVPALTVKEIEFEVKVMEGGLHNLTLIATDYGDHRDAILEFVNVRHNGALKTTHLAGSVDDLLNEVFEFDGEMISGSEKVVLRLAAGYSGLLDEGARMLWGYPYGCTEQLMSRLLPNLMLYENYILRGRYLSGWYQYLIEENIYKGILKLMANQHGDGGWGWWKADRTDAWMTAYVLFGLQYADDMGFTVSLSVMNNARDALLDLQNNDGTWGPPEWMDGDVAAMTAFVGRVLALTGSTPTDAVEALKDLYDDADMDNPYALAMYALFLDEIGADEEDIDDVIDDLIELKVGSHWRRGTSLGGGDETTAWAALALTKADRDAASVRGALEWLADQRRPGGGWGTTSDTIAALSLINELIENQEPIDMDIKVTFNGVELIDMHLDETASSQEAFRSTVDALDLRPYLILDDENELKIQKEGTGDLFYELTTVQYLRKGVEVEYDEFVNAVKGEEFEFEVKVEAVDSDNVKVTQCDVLFNLPYGFDLISYSVEEDDEEFEFTYTIEAGRTGIFNITPIVVSYSLDAGERRSGIVKEYFNGTRVVVSPGGGDVDDVIDDLPTGANIETSKGIPPMAAYGHFYTRPDPLIVKTLSSTLATVGEKVTAKVSAMVPEHHLQREVIFTETLPEDWFDDTDLGTPVDDGEGNSVLTFTTKGELVVEYEYTFTPKSTFRGLLRPTGLVIEGNENTSSNSPTFETVKEDEIKILRDYATTSPTSGGLVEVRLHLKAPSGIDYAAVEDYLPPGARLDTGSAEANLDDNVLSYTSQGDKVVFFIDDLVSETITYNFITGLEGNFSVPAPIVYSMYNESQSAEGVSDLINVLEPASNADWVPVDPTPLITEPGTVESPPAELVISEVKVDGVKVDGKNDIDLIAGTISTIEVTVHNVGYDDLASVSVTLEANGMTVMRKWISFKGQDSQTFTFKWKVKEGTRHMKVIIDEENSIPEYYELNNDVYFNTETASSDDDTIGTISYTDASLILILCAAIMVVHLINTRRKQGPPE